MKLDVILFLIHFVSRLWGWWRKVASFRRNRMSLIYIIIIDWLPSDSSKSFSHFFIVVERKWWKDLNWNNSRSVSRWSSTRRETVSIFTDMGAKYSCKNKSKQPQHEALCNRTRKVFLILILERRTKHYSEQKHFSRAKTKKNTKGEGTIFHSYQSTTKLQLQVVFDLFPKSFLLCWLARTGEEKRFW